MGISIKNKKLLPLILLLIIFGAFLSYQVKAGDCNKHCSDCSNQSNCEGSDAHCEWCKMEGEPTEKCYKALETSWPNSPAGTPLTRCSTLPMMVKYFYEWGISLGGLAAFISLIIAGFQYLTSVGNPTIMKEAMDRIKSASFGMVLLLGSWLILNTINPQLTTFRTGPMDLSGIGDCDTNADCQANYVNYVCAGDPNPGDGKKEGMCMPEIGMPEQKSCEYAIAYSNVNMTGTPTPLSPDKQKDVEAKSVKAFYADLNNTQKEACKKKKGCPGFNPAANENQCICPTYECGDENKCSAGPTAGGCTLQIFAGGFWPWGCGDRVATVPAYESDLYRWVDRQIKCVKLVQPKLLQ